MVSTKHTGFIINDGNASCDDVLELIDKVTEIIEKEFGSRLEKEVIVIGEE